MKQTAIQTIGLENRMQIQKEARHAFSNVIRINLLILSTSLTTRKISSEHLLLGTNDALKSRWSLLGVFQIILWKNNKLVIRFLLFHYSMMPQATGNFFGAALSSRKAVWYSDSSDEELENVELFVQSKTKWLQHMMQKKKVRPLSYW